MSVNQIYTNRVFDQQANGTVFYKQGSVSELPQAGAGVYESWRYNFDAGRQIFRSTGQNKVYEKRLVKDSYGVPKWTSWMEISQGEAHGIQALAINNGIARLPNQDGVLKLEITPALLNAYNRSETDRLIDQKINDNQSKNYYYTPWPVDADGNKEDLTPYEVVSKAYEDDGEEDKLYIVQGKNEGDLTTTFIWDVIQIKGKQKLYDFINVNSPQPTEFFTPMSAFDLHRDNKDASHPDCLHVTRDEKAQIQEQFSKVQFEQFEKNHLTNQSVDPNTGYAMKHVNDYQIQSWNKKLDDVQNPVPGTRYVAYSSSGSITRWQKQLEQIVVKSGDKTIEDLPFGAGVHLFSGDHHEFPKSWAPVIQMLLSANNVIENLKITFSSVDTKGINGYFIFNNNPSYKSKDFFCDAPTPGNYEVDVPLILGTKADGTPAYIDNITWVTPGKVGTMLADLKMTLTYRESGGVELGLDDETNVNIVGKALMFNGVQIDDGGGKTAEWGHIYGEVGQQADLVKYLDDAAFGKLDWAPYGGQNVRYDVINENKFVASLVQHTGYNDPTKPIELFRTTQIKPTPKNNKIVKSGFSKIFADALQDRTKLLHAEVTDVVVKSIGFSIPTYQENIWFYVDDKDAYKSEVIQNPGDGQLIEMDWHLGPHYNWDSIMVGNPPTDMGKNAFTQFNDVRLEIYYVTFDGVQVGPETLDKKLILNSYERPVVKVNSDGEKHLAYFEEIDSKIDQAITKDIDPDNKDNGELVAIDKLTYPETDVIKRTRVTTKVDGSGHEVLYNYFTVGKGLHIEKTEHKLPLDPFDKGTAYMWGLDPNQEFNSVKLKEILSSWDNAPIIQDHRDDSQWNPQGIYIGNPNDTLILRSGKAPANIDGLKTRTNHLVAEIDGEMHLLANYQDIVDKGLDGVMLLSQDQEVNGRKQFNNPTRFYSVESIYSDKIENYEFIAYDPLYAASEQQPYIRVGDTRLPMLFRGKNLPGTDNKYLGHIKTLVDNTYHWLATMEELDDTESNIKSKIGYDLIPGVNDTPFDIKNNSLQQQILANKERFKNYALIDQIHKGKTQADLPYDAIVSYKDWEDKIPTVPLLKAVIDQEKEERLKADEAIADRFQNTETVENKVQSIPVKPATINPTKYPTAHAVREYVENALSINIGNKIDKTNVLTDDDGRKWMLVTEPKLEELNKESQTIRFKASDIESGDARNFDIKLSQVTEDVAGLMRSSDYEKLQNSIDNLMIDKGNNAEEYPTAPVNERVPSSFLVKSYIDKETQRATLVEELLTKQVNDRETIKNKSTEVNATVANNTQYPTTKAVYDFVTKEFGSQESDYIMKDSIRADVDSKRWIIDRVAFETKDPDFLTLRFYESCVEDGTNKVNDITLPQAKVDTAGLMSQQDKQKLDTMLPMPPQGEGNYVLEAKVNANGQVECHWELKVDSLKPLI